MGQEPQDGPSSCLLILHPDGTVRLFDGDDVTVADVLAEFPECQLSGQPSLRPTLPPNTSLSNRRTYYLVPSVHERRMLTQLKKEEHQRQQIELAGSQNLLESSKDTKASAHRRTLSMTSPFAGRKSGRGSFCLENADFSPNNEACRGAGTADCSSAPPALVQRSWTMGRDRSKSESTASSASASASNGSRPSTMRSLISRTKTMSKNDSQWGNFGLRCSASARGAPKGITQSAPYLAVSPADVRELQADLGFDNCAPTFVQTARKGNQHPSNPAPFGPSPPASAALQQPSLSMPRASGQAARPTPRSDAGSTVSPALQRPSLSMPRLSSATADQGFSSSSIFMRRGAPLDNLGMLQLNRPTAGGSNQAPHKSPQHASGVPTRAPHPRALAIPRGPLTPPGNFYTGNYATVNAHTSSVNTRVSADCTGDLYAICAEEVPPETGGSSAIGRGPTASSSSWKEQASQGFDPRTPSPVRIGPSKSLPRGHAAAAQRPPKAQVSPHGRRDGPADGSRRGDSGFSLPPVNRQGDFSGQQMEASGSFDGRSNRWQPGPASRRLVHRRTASTIECSSALAFGGAESLDNEVSQAETMEAWGRLLAFASAGADVDKRPGAASKADVAHAWPTASSPSVSSSEGQISPQSPIGSTNAAPPLSPAEMALCDGPLQLSWQ